MKTILHPLLLLLLSLSPLQTGLRAQICWNRGAQPVAAAWEPGPDMACARAPGWPWWHMHTPDHRLLVVKPGFRPGNTRTLPRILIHYRCTGWLLLPVVVDRVRTMGEVFDTEDFACFPAAGIAP